MKSLTISERIRGNHLCMMLLVAVAWHCGCASRYVVPAEHDTGRSLMGITADQRDRLTDVAVADRQRLRPLAALPTSLAVVRVKSSYCYSCKDHGLRYDRFDVVTNRDVERDENIERLARLPMVNGVVALNRLTAPHEHCTTADLRHAVANLHADMLLIYAIDTESDDEEGVLAPLSAFTLGIFPATAVRAATTASAVLMDTRNGYIYSAVEATDKAHQATNGWTRWTAMEQSRRRAERAAFAAMLDEFEQAWSGVVHQYARGTPAGPIYPTP